MIIKHGDGTAFQRVPEGVNVYELTGKFEAMKPTDDTKEDKAKNVKFLEWALSDEPSMTFNQRIDLDNEKSLRAFMDSLFFSGYCNKMHTKNPQKYPDPEKGWDDTMIRHEMFAKDLMIHGVGCRASLHIVYNKVSGKDGDKIYTNIAKWESVSNKSTNTPKTDRSTATTPTPTKDNSEWGN